MAEQKPESVPPQNFVVVIEKDGKASKHGVQALNLESVLQLMTILVAVRFPKVAGYVVLSADEKTIHASVPALAFVTQIDAQLLHGGVPVIRNSADFNKLVEEQKRLREEEKNKGFA